MSQFKKIKDSTDDSREFKLSTANLLKRNWCPECPPYKGCNCGKQKSKSKHGKQKHKIIIREKIEWTDPDSE